MRTRRLISNRIMLIKDCTGDDAKNDAKEYSVFAYIYIYILLEAGSSTILHLAVDSMPKDCLQDLI